MEKQSSQLVFGELQTGSAKKSFSSLGSKAWQEMIELGGGVAQVFSLPRSTGQIFGLLFFSKDSKNPKFSKK